MYPWARVRELERRLEAARRDFWNGRASAEECRRLHAEIESARSELFRQRAEAQREVRR